MSVSNAGVPGSVGQVLAGLNAQLSQLPGIAQHSAAGDAFAGGTDSVQRTDREQLMLLRLLLEMQLLGEIEQALRQSQGANPGYGLHHPGSIQSEVPSHHRPHPHPEHAAGVPFHGGPAQSSHANIPQTPGGSPSRYDGLIAAAAKKYHIDPNAIKAVIKNESHFDPHATSPTGAMGLMQLEPGTAREMGVHDAYDPAQNIDGGTRYLRKLLDEFHENGTLAVAAYNAGPGRVERAGGVPNIAETQTYVARVKESYAEYSRLA